MIPLFWPTIYKDEWLTELEKVFSTRWIGQGPMVDKFEKEFGKKFGFDYCLSVNSGTAALELAYHLIDIKEGDEVLVPVFTCTATNMPLLRRGARLKFLDVNDKLVVDYKDLKKKISKNVKAIVVTTLGGIQIDSRVFKLAKKYSVPVVIDAAQSVGIKEPNGDYVCYSFQAIKHFTTGDGGMLVVRNQKEYKRAKKLRWFGIDRDKKRRMDWKWHVNHKMALDIEEAGFKYHMNDIAAAMGIVGLRHSDEALKYRRKLCNLYRKLLPKHKLIYGGACWLIAIVSDNRNKLMDKLEENGIESDLIQIRNDAFEVFGQEVKLPNMSKIEDKYFYLPLHLNLSIQDVEYIASVINKK